MDKLELLAEINNRLRQAFGDRLKGVVLYGSQVRGEAGPDSDVDVLVLLDEVASYLTDARICAAALQELSIELGRPIHAKPTPQELYERQAAPLYVEAHREGLSAI